MRQKKTLSKQRMLSHMSLLKQIKDSKVVIIYRGHTPNNCLKLSQILMEKGLSFFEVTMNSKDCLESIQLLKKELPNAHIGAGTVTKVEEVDQAAKAGATYIISPNTNVKVIKRTKELGLLSIPGAFTPTEVETAWTVGADLVKVFPINVVGPKYIKQLQGPLDEILLMPSGGITIDITEKLFQAGATAVGVGVQILGEEFIQSMDSKALQRNALKLLKAANVST